MKSTIKMNKDNDKFIVSYELYDEMGLPKANGKGVFILEDEPPFRLLCNLVNYKEETPLGPFECFKFIEPDHEEEFDETKLEHYCETVNDAFNHALDFIHDNKSEEVAKIFHECFKFQ